VATTTHDIRVLTRTRHVAAAAAAFRTAMVGLPLPAFDDAHAAALAEPGRTLGAFDGGQVIGGAGSYTSWLTVPGGERVPHAAVTQVGVLPTHTRRGVLTALLRRQLADIAARGEVVASLRASEAVIYERFGYGIATWAADYELDRRRGLLRDTLGAAARSGWLAGPNPGSRWPTSTGTRPGPARSTGRSTGGTCGSSSRRRRPAPATSRCTGPRARRTGT
jgi:GNAT superfamily N-acetyltransferase